MCKCTWGCDFFDFGWEGGVGKRLDIPRGDVRFLEIWFYSF